MDYAEQSPITDPARWRASWPIFLTTSPPCSGSRGVWCSTAEPTILPPMAYRTIGSRRLSIAPVTLGAGAPLLPRHLLASDLTLVNVERQGQFVSATYRVGRASD
jgi:hypothetical protein